MRKYITTEYSDSSSKKPYTEMNMTQLESKEERTVRYTGDLWLDYISDEEEAHYSAKITSFVLTETHIIFEYSGNDDGHPYSGSGTLKNVGNTYEGVCSFTHAGEDNVPAKVELKVERDKNRIYLEGTWRDEGDTGSFDLSGDVVKI